MDCKHEKGLKWHGTFGDKPAYDCIEDCDLLFTEDEVIILTKAQHDLTQAVVEAIRKADPAHIAFLLEDRGLPIGRNRMNAVEKALTALDKGDENKKKK